ncbi:MAG: cytidine deaminase [Rikenellaceae bacterium]|nr:cytidine deaminase [Rikenellaceae bacterium]
MEKKTIPVEYTVVNNGELQGDDLIIFNEARKATENSFAPHSNFRVGAAALLDDGTIVYGANQESDVYPAGLCAERVLLFNKLSNYQCRYIRTIAITARNDSGFIDGEIFPCGMCTQTLIDAEKRQKSPIRIIMAGKNRSIIIDSAKRLMPFEFTLE